MNNNTSAVIGKIISVLIILPIIRSCASGSSYTDNNYYQPQGSQGYQEHYNDNHYQNKYGYSYCQIHPVADGC